MTELGQWAAGWLERLARHGGSPGVPPGRNLVLHDAVWGPIDPRQVDEHLRWLRRPGVGDRSRHGNCAVTFEAPWQGRPALWIEAVTYHHGTRRDEITLVRALPGHGPAVSVPSGAPYRHPIPTPPKRLTGPQLTRPPQVQAAMYQQILPKPMFSPRGTFWLWFFLCFLWPLLLVFLVIDFRRAEARGEGGGRLVRAALFGTLVSAALSAVLILLVWFTFLASLR